MMCAKNCTAAPMIFHIDHLWLIKQPPLRNKASSSTLISAIFCCEGVDLSGPMTKIQASSGAFAAIAADGHVVAWGAQDRGGLISADVRLGPCHGVTHGYKTHGFFA